MIPSTFQAPASHGGTRGPALRQHRPSSHQPRKRPIKIPAPVADLPAQGGTRSIVLAGGCFWGLQGMFEHVKGVKRVVAGYAGGEASTAHYQTVGTGEDRTCRIRQDRLRSRRDLLRAVAATVSSRRRTTRRRSTARVPTTDPSTAPPSS